MSTVDYTRPNYEKRYAFALRALAKGVEVWADVLGYEGLYKVSNFGRVKSLARRVYKKDGSLHYTQRERVLKYQVSTNGYPMVNLTSGISGIFCIHYLVLITFVGPKPDDYQCRHLDGVRTNNLVNNLLWGTVQENADDRKKHGTNVGNRGRTRGMHYNCGELGGKSKLKNEDVFAIRQMYRDGVRNLAMIARIYGVTRPSIADIVAGKKWRHLL